MKACLSASANVGKKIHGSTVPTSTTDSTERFYFCAPNYRSLKQNNHFFLSERNSSMNFCLSVSIVHSEQEISFNSQDMHVMKFLYSALGTLRIIFR